MTAREVADLLGGRLEGDPSVALSGVAGLREASPGQASFLEDPRYAPLLAATRASLVILAADVAAPAGVRLNLLRVEKPGAAFGRLVEAFAPPPPRFAPGVHPRACVDPEAKVHPRASIQPFAVVEAGAEVGEGTVIGAGGYLGHGARVGRDCFFWPRVTVRERCLVGDRVILHPGVVLGSDGFGYDFAGGRYVKVPQVGIVQVDDDVEIGANATVDRGRFGRTWIRRGVKIDNLVQVAHNVVVGEDTAIAAQAGISGSTQVGHHVRIAGQVGTVGHITIGDGATLMAQSGVSRDVEKGTTVFGYPAQEQSEAMRTYGAIRRLPQMIERLRKLEKLVAGLLKGAKP
jgi:UDP-3-O-[3-hydroxymyristoyl] glucosamine N-acyltransferase